EHELVQVSRARATRRAGSPARAGPSRRHGGAGDAAFRSGDRTAVSAALQGGSPRLSLLPRARSDAAERLRRTAAGGLRTAAGAARRARGEVPGRAWIDRR